MTSDELVQTMAAALEGVRFVGESPDDGVISESSHAGETYRPGLFTRDWPYSSGQVAKLPGLDEDVPVESEPFSDFVNGQSSFGEHLRDASGEERLMELEKLLKDHLYAPRAFRIGDGVTRLDCYVLGYHESGEILGFKTSILEK
jgi:hypothetical protein